MSSQEIGALIKSVNEMTATVASKMGDIDNKVLEATEAVPSTVKQLFDQTLYVNEITGSDNNDGFSSSTALQYLSAAVAKAPSAGKVRIIAGSNISKLDSWPLNGRNKHQINIRDGRNIHVDLNGNTLFIATSHYNQWGEDKLNSEFPSLDKNFQVKVNSFLEISNGRIRINAQSGDEGKQLYGHSSMSSIFNNDSSRTQISSVDIESTVATCGLFGLDNWGAMGFNAHIRDSTLTGVGKLKVVVNEADVNDIIIKKINVTSTWTE